MSWLNKFLKIFQDKEVTEFEEQTVMNYEERKTDNRVKELDARVTYQYPNGKFRFPLISDEEKLNITTNGKRLKRYERKQEATENATELYQEFKGHVIESTRKEPRVRFSERIQEEQKNHLKNRNQKDPTVTLNKRINQEQRHEPKELGTKIESRTKITKKGSRPFQPTEIPSPIYGFTKRTIPSEIVEFELESDEPLNIEVTQHVNHTRDEKLIDNYYDEFDITTKLETTVADYIEVEIEDEIEVEIEEVLEVEIEEELEVEIEDEIEVENEDVIEDEIEVKIEDVTEEEIDEIEEEIEELLEEKIETLKIQTSAELEQEDQKNVVPTDEIEKKPVQRSHLPFNVLMLKQDKRKWEQKVFEGPKQNNEIDTVILEKNEIQKNAIDIPQPGLLQNGYIFPSLTLLNPPMTSYDEENIEWIENQEQLLNEALKNFGVRASVVNITQGPSVTRFEVQPEPGVKVNKITNLSDDIKLSLAAKDIRIEAPIPGKHTIGIEVPNKKSRPVFISEIIKSKEFLNSASPLTAVLGLDISGAPVVTDLKKMPHGLIAGATGSGKSVCINSILISLLFKASPQELKLLLIDPKMVELAPYNHIPHLVSPVITDVKAATASLKWAVDEMERRYELFAHVGVRDINRFNEIAESHKRYSEKLPFIVIIIDELADLMMMSPADVEESICRIAQKARACGIHLIIATQRPSVDVITGLIKANVPTRTAFSVSSQIDSRTIIDISGAEKLLGRGDMLFLENGSSKPVRLQGTFVSDEEIDMVVQHVRDQQEPQYLFHQEELLKKAQVIEDEDELFYEACEFVIDQGGASTSSVQRRFKIGYNRAARLIDMMEQQGFISEPKGSKPRDVLITEEELEQIQETTSSTFI